MSTNGSMHTAGSKAFQLVTAGDQGPDLQNILRQCYDTAKVTINLHTHTHTLAHTHTHTGLTVLCPGLPEWAGTRKVKPIWILLKQETVSGSGISWTICKSAPCSTQITTPATHHSVFTGRMPFLPPNQQRQSTDLQRMYNLQNILQSTRGFS